MNVVKLREKYFSPKPVILTLKTPENMLQPENLSHPYNNG